MLPCREIGIGSYRDFAFTIIALSFLYKYNVLWASAMPKVSVTLFNAISNSAFIFVYGFSVCLLSETLTLGKAGSVLLTATGVALVILFPSEKGAAAHPTTFFGLSLSFACAVGQAFYSVVYKVWIGRNGPRRPLALSLIVLGLIGVSTLLLFWPFVLGANALGIESGALPDKHQIPIWVGNFVLAVFSNVTLFLALCFVSPLLVAVGQLLQMPGASLADWELHEESVRPWRAFGFVLIFVGFVALTMAQRPHAAAGEGISGNEEEDGEEAGRYQYLEPGASA